MEGENIHQRIHKLKDVALGSKKAVSVSSSLAPASYDSAVDSLLALYCECKSASSLAKDKNVLKFIKKCEYTGGYDGHLMEYARKYLLHCRGMNGFAVLVHSA